MLDNAQSKQVRRGDLHSRASSLRSSPDPGLLDLLRNKLNRDITFIERQFNAEQADIDAEEQEDDLVSFRLFATTSTTKGTQTVRIRSPSIEAHEAGFVQPHRSLSYYFADVDSSGSLAEYEAVAVDGEDVMLRSRQTCPGCRMPWRVTRIDAAQDKTVRATTKNATSSPQSISTKKIKPGKKHRIALRIKHEAAETAERAQQQAAADKAAADREKRTKHNREKKLKRKEKEKAKKLAMKAT